jgi:glutamyl-tRNA synthetase
MNKANFFNDFNELKKYIENNTSLKENEIEKIITYLVLGNENGPDMNNIYPLIKNYIGEIIK